jgi:hypothetical protein
MQEDVGHIDAEDTAASTETDGASNDKGTLAGGNGAGKASDASRDGKKADAQDKPAEDGKGAQKGTIAAGAADSEEKPAAAEKKAEKASIADVQSWREEMAEYAAAGDKKAYQKELKRLERISDPRAVYGMYREMEGKFTGGGLIKVPGKDAKPEDIEQFNKALGVPEKAEEYTKNLTLDNGAVVGEADKPYVDSFAEYMHKSSARPAEFKAALNWYYAQQEQNAARMDEEDEEHQRESVRALKDEYGPAYNRRINAIGSIFAAAPGGADASNEKSVYARLMGGRTSDGRLIGNDPDMIRWFDSLRGEINPAASVVEDGSQSAKTVEDEIKQIEKVMREDRKTYNRDYATRYGELLKVREKLQARA